MPSLIIRASQKAFTLPTKQKVVSEVRESAVNTGPCGHTVQHSLIPGLRGAKAAFPGTAGEGTCLGGRAGGPEEYSGVGSEPLGPTGGVLTREERGRE